MTDQRIATIALCILALTSVINTWLMVLPAADQMRQSNAQYRAEIDLKARISERALQQGKAFEFIYKNGSRALAEWYVRFIRRETK